MANEHLNLIHSKMDNSFYLEHPFIGYEFIKLPRFSFIHNEPIEFNTKETSSAFADSVNECINKLYPLYLKPHVTQDMITKRWTNLFIINSKYIHKDKYENQLCYFLINNNDTAENYLQAFCELYKIVDIERTKEAMQRFNPNLYEYLNIDYVILEINKMGVFQEVNIMNRGETPDDN